MNRRRYNRFIADSIINLDKYQPGDFKLDQDYLEYKPRDVWKVVSDPPYIASGGQVSINGGNPLLVDIAALVALDSDFREIDIPGVVGFPLFDQTPSVINYLTAVYLAAEDFGTNRATFKNPAVSYNAAVLDSGRFQWKLAASINPEQTGTTTGPFHLTAFVNDNVVFATDQSSPEYVIPLATNVASVTGSVLGSGTVFVVSGDILDFTIDGTNYNLTLATSGTVFTISGIATQINSLAMLSNPFLTDNVAFAIYNQNRLRITSPRDLTPVVSKHVLIHSGSANSTLGFTNGSASYESTARTAQNVVDEINIATSPEITASVVSNRVKVKAQNPTGFLELRNSQFSAFGTFGISFPFTVFGAQAIDFNNDVILSQAYVSGSAVVLDNVNRTHVLKLFDSNTGWEEHAEMDVPLYVVSGIPDDVTVTLSNYYVVGAYELEVFLSGKRLTNTNGYDEVGTIGSKSNQVAMYSVINDQDVFFRVVTAAPSNVPNLKVFEDSTLIVNGVDGLNFGPEFSVTTDSGGIAVITIGTGGLSGSIMNHGFMHEFGGSQEITVDNLRGLLRFPQKNHVYVNGALMYAPTSYNYTGVGVTVTPFSSGIVNINIPGNVFVDEAGDSIIRLGFDGGTAYPNLTLQDDLTSLWNLTVDNEGHLITELTASGTPVSVILQAPNSGTLYILGIERTLGSGELTTTFTPSGVPLTFSLTAPNGKSWGVRVDSGGILSTLDPDNIFQIRNSDNEPVLTVFENGLVRLNLYVSGAVSGTVQALPAAFEGSGCIAVYGVSGTIFPVFSNGITWNRLLMVPFSP